MSVTHTTPLKEVAALLPKNSATFLLNESEDIQERCLIVLRSHMAYWEEERLALDPIAWAVILDGITVTTIEHVKQIAGLALALQAEVMLNGRQR